MTPTCDHITTSDGITFVADVYTNTETSRPTVLLLHGGGQNRHAWATTAGKLHRQGYTVIAELADDLLTVRDRYSPGHPQSRWERRWAR